MQLQKVNLILHQLISSQLLLQQQLLKGKGLDYFHLFFFQIVLYMKKYFTTTLKTDLIFFLFTIKFFKLNKPFPSSIKQKAIE